jgi:putative membrane protein
MLERASLSLLVSVLLGSAACESEPARPPESPQTTAATTSTFTVRDIFGALRAIHAAEVEHGMLAQKKATDPRVKAFATNVVADHELRMDKDDQLMRELRIKAKDNRVSTWIKSVSDRRMARLDSLSGSEFDHAYLEEQINYHRAVLDTFDKDLTPNARGPQVKADIAEARERESDHLKEAQDLRAALASGASGRSDP